MHFSLKFKKFIYFTRFSFNHFIVLTFWLINSYSLVNMAFLLFSLIIIISKVNLLIKFQIEESFIENIDIFSWPDINFILFFFLYKKIFKAKKKKTKKR